MRSLLKIPLIKWLVAISLVLLTIAGIGIAKTYYPQSQPTSQWSYSSRPVSQPTVSLSPSSSVPQPTPTEPLTSPSTSTSPKPVSPKSTTSNHIQLSVPFTVQAPDGDWSEPWQEGCEEAALLMVDAFNHGDHRSTLPVAETKAAIKTMVDWEIEHYGSHKDIGVDLMADLAKNYLKVGKTRVVKSATLEQIKDELRAGHPVIVPAKGRLLNNPYFKQPGPPYHVFVITGFHKTLRGDSYIANENGTKRGLHYKYDAVTLSRALSDEGGGPMAYLILEN